jgi:hypothetical protein
MAVVLLSDDLMVASRVDGAARRVGVTLLTAVDVAGVVSHCTTHGACRVIVDLSSRAADVATLFARLEAAGIDRPATIAFGPHVHEKLLTAAADAGCDVVVSRGQFFAQLDSQFARVVEADSNATAPIQDEPHQGDSSDA